MSPLETFVSKNLRWFYGRGQEAAETISKAEQQLGVNLPSELKWILCEHGYWYATGISSLEEAIVDTLSAREHLDMPSKLIVLYNHQDGGGIIMDTEGSNTIYNIEWVSFPHAIESAIVYSSYLEYVTEVLADAEDIIDSEDVDCS